MSNWPRQRWVLPDPVNPPDTVCFQINVPNEIHHIAAFYGAIFGLSRPYNWGDDLAHTALAVGSVWAKIFDDLIKGNCTIPAKPGSAGADDGSEFMIRQNPDNPCELQSSVDGVNWCTFADFSKCFPPPGQPGGGQPQPKPGECVTYHAVEQGISKWLLPTGVSTGDTIEITDAAGAIDDSTSSWYCPGGELFLLGICTGLTTVFGTDPVPAAPYMKLIAKIGSTFYDVFNGVFTVPAGHANDPVEFQPNRNTLSGQNGTWEYNVKVCNNQSSDVGINYVNGSGISTAPYGSVITVSSATVGADERFDISFDHPVKLTILAQSGYVNVGTPGPANVWAGWTLGGTIVGSLVDPPATVPTDFPPNQVVDSLNMSTAGAGTPFSVQIKMEHP